MQFENTMNYYSAQRNMAVTINLYQLFTHSRLAPIYYSLYYFVVWISYFEIALICSQDGPCKYNPTHAAAFVKDVVNITKVSDPPPPCVPHITCSSRSQEKSIYLLLTVGDLCVSMTRWGLWTPWPGSTLSALLLRCCPSSCTTKMECTPGKS